ncbi:MAG: TatD family hydrolase [Rhodothermus sp.]|nr:TatD family hydrolase [Rhodothermus sp.]
MITLVDTHVHLYLEAFEADRDDVVARARAAGVVSMILPAIDVASVHQALALCDRYPGVYAMAALHPSETRQATEADFDEVARLCEDPRVVAVGESGLDYYWDRSFMDRQQAFLRQHIRLAIEMDLPLILHNREASEDLVRILQEERDASAHPERLRGIFHCFTGPAWVAEAAAELGFLLGIGGILTFKKSGLAELVRTLPLEQMVLETDAPFLAPVPHRGKRNEPAYVRHVAEKLAALKGVPLEEVARITTTNARRIFRLPEDQAERTGQ